MNTRKIIKIGNSSGSTIPSEVLRKLNLSIGDEIQYVISRRGKIALYKYVPTSRSNINAISKQFKR